MKDKIPDNKTIEHAVGISSAMQAVNDRNLELAQLTSLPQLAESSDTIAEKLTNILTQVTVEPQYAEAASLVATRISGDGEISKLDYLGYALVLAAEAQQGHSNELDFQQTTRVLLAQNGYRPFRINERYQFFKDEEGMKMVALSNEGVGIYTAQLGDKYCLDELIDDFDRLKFGEPVKKLRKKAANNGAIKAFSWVGAIAATLFGTLYLQDAVSEEISNPVIWTGIGLAFTELALTIYSVTSSSERKYIEKHQDKPEYRKPFETLNSGVYALIDAFPLEKNKLRLVDSSE